MAFLFTPFKTHSFGHLCHVVLCGMLWQIWNFWVQSTLNNWKSLNWNFQLIGSDAFVRAILHAIHWNKLLANSKLKLITEVN